MLNAHLEPLFDDVGTIVTPDRAGLRISDLDQQDVIRLFERTGVVLFRGFDITPESLPAVTDLYTETYSGDAERRAQRFDQRIIRNVDMGARAVLLHSEASFTPAWPEIIWFFCVTPPEKDGATTICDGIAAWSALSNRTKDFFQLNPVRYDLRVPIGQKRPGRGTKPWMYNSLGVGDAMIDWDAGVTHLTQVRSAVTEGRTKNTLCFANHLIVHMDSEDQLINRSLLDGSPLPSDVMDEIRSVTDRHTHEILWQAGDVAMIDNKRVMHGRRAYEAGDRRDIVIVQTARASFAYGATTRDALGRSRP